MSMSIGSVGGAALAAQSAQQQVSDAVATTSLSHVKERGREAVDLIKTAMSVGSSNRLVDTYA